MSCAAENLLMRRQGKGTFVATQCQEQVQFRFLRLAPDHPDQPTDASRRESSTAVACVRRPMWLVRWNSSPVTMVVEVRRCCTSRASRSCSMTYLAAGPPLQGPDGRAPEPMTRPDVRAFLNPNSACA